MPITLEPQQTSPTRECHIPTDQRPPAVQRTSRYSLLVAACILAAAFFYATSVRDGHDWGGDFAQYILHAQALLQGQPYAPPPGFVPNHYLSWAPPAYPPLLPVGIAGLIALFGLNFIAIKLLVVTLFILGLAAYWRFARIDLPLPAAFGALILLAFSPYLLKFSNKILSDIPYLSVSLFSILAAQRFFRSSVTRKDALLLVICLVLSTCMRTVGLALLLSVPVYALFFRRTHLVRAFLS
ncbi:MAG: hypothetical protein O2954_10040, partial [bacterium]|nr:hypothetical protein [bacterium]